MTPEQAHKFHSELDHSELGHNHDRTSSKSEDKEKEAA